MVAVVGISVAPVINPHNLPLVENVLLQDGQDLLAFRGKDASLMVKGQLFPILHPVVPIHGLHHLADIFQNIFLSRPDLKLQAPLPALPLKQRNQLHMAGEIRLEIPGLFPHGAGVDNISKLLVRILRLHRLIHGKRFIGRTVVKYFQGSGHTVLAHAGIRGPGLALTGVLFKRIGLFIILKSYMILVAVRAVHVGRNIDDFLVLSLLQVLDLPLLVDLIASGVRSGAGGSTYGF